MEPIKKAMISAVGLALAAAIFAGIKFSAAAKTNAALTILNRQQDETVAQIAELEIQLQTETKHAQTVESDNALLADALKRAEAAQTLKTKPTVKLPTQKEVADRLQHAQALVRHGDPAEALRELVECYEESRRVGGNALSRIGVVIREVGTLGERYPEALSVLREWRDALRQQVLAGPGGSDAVADFSSTAKALKEDRSILELYDAVPPDDPRRSWLGIYAFRQLFETQRYADAAQARPYTSMISMFDGNSSSEKRTATPGSDYLVKATTDNIEVLAGAGELEHARLLAARLLAYDGSEETKAVLKTRLARAGHPDLLAPAP